MLPGSQSDEYRVRTIDLGLEGHLAQLVRAGIGGLYDHGQRDSARWTKHFSHWSRLSEEHDGFTIRYFKDIGEEKREKS